MAEQGPPSPPDPSFINPCMSVLWEGTWGVPWAHPPDHLHLWWDPPSPINILKRIPVVTSEPTPGGLRGEWGWREQEWGLHWCPPGSHDNNGVKLC